MPGHWPGDYADDLFIPPLQLTRMESFLTRISTPHPTHEDEMSSLTRISTPYPTHEDDMITHGYSRDIRPSGNVAPYPINENETRNFTSRLQKQKHSHHEGLPPYPTSPTLCIPGLGLPTERDREVDSSRSPVPEPQAPVDERLLPRMNLRVDTLMQQTASLNVSSPSDFGELQSPRLSILAEPSHSSQHASQSRVSSSAQNELFLDRPSQLSNSPSNNHSKQILSYQELEPILPSQSILEHTEWQLYEPPEELRLPREETSIIIESILVPSIVRIRARYEDEERRMAAELAKRDAQEPTNLSVVSRGDHAPETNAVGDVGGWQVTTGHPLQNYLTPSDLVSTASLSSSVPSPNTDDSGYGSTSPGADYAPSAPTRSRRSFGRFGERASALFNRVNKSTGNQTAFDGLPSALDDQSRESVSSMPRLTTSLSANISGGSRPEVEL